MAIITQNIAQEIKDKLEKLSQQKGYDKARHRAVTEDLRTIGDVYSFWIENPDLRKSLLRGRNSKQTIRKQAARGIRAIKNGWYYLNDVCKRDCVGSLDISLLEKLNGLIEPRKGGRVRLSTLFRSGDVTLNILGYTPPSPERIAEKLKALIGQVREMYTQEPLEAAIMAHLGIACIQPFPEGNKRCARLVQDKILWDAGMPPAVIQAGEGTYYFGLLSQTAPAYRDEKTEGMREFFDYCASKVNNGLDTMLNDLQNQ